MDTPTRTSARVGSSVALVALSRAAAVSFCLSPIYIALALVLLEPSRWGRMLALGWVLLLVVAATVNVRAAFSRCPSLSLWVYSILGSLAAAFLFAFLVSGDGRVTMWLLSAVLVLPSLVLASWNLAWSFSARKAEA